MGDVNKFCDAMIWAADSNQVGYNQYDRYNLTANDFFSNGLYNTDCSALTIAALQYAGYDTGSATYTGNISSNLTARGWTRIAPDWNPQKGYILLNDACHVAVWCGDRLAQASIDENGNIAGGLRGDQSGSEVNTRGYYNYPWDCYLVPPADSTYSTTPTKKKKRGKRMECLIRPNGEDYMVYFDGTKAHPLTHPDEMVALQEVYRKCNDGAEMPCFEFGSKKSPWAARLFEAAAR